MKSLDEIKSQLNNPMVINDWDANIYNGDQVLNIESEIREGLLRGDTAVIIGGVYQEQLSALRQLGYILNTIGDFSEINLTDTIKKYCLKCGREIPLKKNMKYCSRLCYPSAYQKKRTEGQQVGLERKKKIGMNHCNDLKKRYNLTHDEYADMLEYQDNRCGICGMPIKKARRRFAVDHDHKTGQIRGLLCTSCNLGLGYFKDSTKRLRDAITYIRSHRENLDTQNNNPNT